jgi:hypothetical protein
MKNIVFMNTAWIVIAAAAFVVGRVSVHDASAEADKQPAGKRGSAGGRPGITASKSDRAGPRASRAAAESPQA